MTWICSECAKPVQLLVQLNPDNSCPEDFGEPVYRRQTIAAGKRIVIQGYCGPECSTQSYNERVKKRI